MEKGLLKCPFCGDEDIKIIDRIDVSDGMHTLYHAKCSGCGASTDEQKSQFDAIMAWNRRV
ncbi:MAG: Lar family restriction alleviation protein [Lachnospiraceae bacterium]|nr:Lar family restriction alleviation protein [Lachnospiraceae bacterium]